ncbi:uncharacterized protein V6R79_007619 [Siganus canaliculatus]
MASTKRIKPAAPKKRYGHGSRSSGHTVRRSEVKKQKVSEKPAEKKYTDKPAEPVKQKVFQLAPPPKVNPWGTPVKVPSTSTCCLDLDTAEFPLLETSEAKLSLPIKKVAKETVAGQPESVTDVSDKAGKPVKPVKKKKTVRFALPPEENPRSSSARLPNSNTSAKCQKLDRAEFLPFKASEANVSLPNNGVVKVDSNQGPEQKPSQKPELELLPAESEASTKRSKKTRWHKKENVIHISSGLHCGYAFDRDPQPVSTNGKRSDVAAAVKPAEKSASVKPAEKLAAEKAVLVNTAPVKPAEKSALAKSTEKSAPATPTEESALVKPAEKSALAMPEEKPSMVKPAEKSSLVKPEREADPTPLCDSPQKSATKSKALSKRENKNKRKTKRKRAKKDSSGKVNQEQQENLDAQHSVHPGRPEEEAQDPSTKKKKLSLWKRFCRHFSCCFRPQIES